jgi:hypothetical protein
VSNYAFHSSWDVFTDTDTDWVLDSTFGSIPFGAGRFAGSRCLKMDNTGFGVKGIIRDVPLGSGSWFHFAFRQYIDSGSAFGLARSIFRIEVGSTSEALFQILTRPSDFKLDCVYGGTTLTTNAVFTPGTTGDPTSGVWRSIEILYDVSGDIKIYIDDVLDIDMNVTTSNHQPDRVRFFWENIGTYGYQVDDFAVKTTNGGGGAASLREGPVRINNWLLGKDEVTGWGRVGAASNAACMHDHYGVTGTAPDGDSTFVQVTIPAKDLYTLTPLKSCTGKILAVGTVLVAKLISGSPSIRTISRIDPTNSLSYAIGLDHALLVPYTIFHGYADLSPRTGIAWTDGEVENALWGVESLGSGISRATMVSIEKVQLIDRTVAFNCGGTGSYAFMR